MPSSSWEAFSDASTRREPASGPDCALAAPATSNPTNKTRLTTFSLGATNAPYPVDVRSPQGVHRSAEAPSLSRRARARVEPHHWFPMVEPEFAAELHRPYSAKDGTRPARFKKGEL